jgi:hypothetical protein
MPQLLLQRQLISTCLLVSRSRRIVHALSTASYLLVFVVCPLCSVWTRAASSLMPAVMMGVVLS